MEINQESEVTQEMHGLWYKVVAVLLWKHCKGKDTITVEDMDRFQAAHPEMGVVLFHSHKESIDLELVSVEEGLRRAKEVEIKGGLVR